MSKKIKLVTTLDSGGVLDSTILLNKNLLSKGYNSSVIKVDKFKKNIIKYINYGDHIIFQMSAYGYHKKGIPLWLINEIKLIKKKSASLGIHFHELNIQSNFWKPQFLIMVLQKYINIQLLKYCDYWVTSTIQYSNWLKKFSFRKKNYICPVHSNIDHDFKKIKKDRRIVVLFGTSESRTEIYQNYFKIIENWIIKNDLILYDVGPRINNRNINDLIKKNISIKICGKLSTLKIKNLFSKAYLGIFSKPDKLINKSGTLAAYSKYKVCPINLDNLNTKSYVKLTKLRYLKLLPNKNYDKKKIIKICNVNFKFSKKNDIENYVKTYLKNLH